LHREIALFSNKIIIKWLQKARTIIISLALLLSLAPQSQARPAFKIEFSKFFSDHENILLYRPELIKEIFISIVDLKGNQAQSKKMIYSQVLACNADAGIAQGCRIDQLRLERKKIKMPKLVVIPVNFTRISARIFNKRKKRLTINWNPELIHPPSITIEAFLDYVRAARESKFYSIRDDIVNLQINTLLQRKIDFVVENELAGNLLQIYKSPPSDFQDSITFAFDFMTTSKRFATHDCFLQFKAVSIKINQQTFKTTDLKR
jgi:hypothetical protein